MLKLRANPVRERNECLAMPGNLARKVLSKGERGMNKSFFKIFAMFFLLVFAASLSAGTLENKGQAWLDAQTDPAAINVSGTWKSSVFGELSLSQAAGSREVTGSGGAYELTGVVSGKELFLLFGDQRGTVNYCAVLNSEGDNSLAGTYHYRTSRIVNRGGLCQEKSYPISMKKQ